MKNTSLLFTLMLIAHLGICQTVSVPGGVVGTSSDSFMGIGTSTPNENLTVSSNGNVYIGIQKPAYSNKLTLGIVNHSGILNYSAGNPLNSNLYFRTNNINRLKINHSGDVGIGTSSPGVYNTNSSYQIFNANDIVFDVQGEIIWGGYLPDLILAMVFWAELHLQNLMDNLMLTDK